MVESLHDVWLHPDGRVWLAHHLSSHKDIFATSLLQFQQVVGLYVKIANSLEYRRAVKDKKEIDPRVYQEANGRARHIISSMNNLIPEMAFSIFVIEPVTCGLFHIEDQATKDKRQTDKKPKDDPVVGSAGHTEGCTGGGRRDDSRASPRDKTCSNT
jgi:hypothetical protein